MIPWWLVSAHLLQSPLRAALLLIALGAGFHLATILQSIHSSISNGILDDPVLRVSPGPERSVFQGMPLRELEKMRNIPGVVAVSPSGTASNLYFQHWRNSIKSKAVFVEDYLRIHDIALSESERACMRDTRMGLLVGRELARVHDWQAGDRIPIRGGGLPTKSGDPPWPFVLCGIYDPPSPRAGDFLYHWDYQIENSIFPGPGSAFQSVRVAPRVDLLEMSREIDALFADTPYPTYTEPKQAQERRSASMAEHAGRIVVSVSAAGVFALAVLFAAAAVQEFSIRRQEFASMRAIGFGPGRLSLLVLMENCALALAAACIGICTAFAMEDWYRSLLTRLFGPFAVPPGAAVATLALACAAGIAATALPCALIRRSRAAQELHAEPGG